MKLFPVIGLFVLLSLNSMSQHSDKFVESHSDIHKVMVMEVLQTTSYTYLKVLDGNKMQWLAVPRMEAKHGETYYYKGGNEMKNFRSSQLNRVFDSVLFLGGIVSANPGKSMNADSTFSFSDSIPESDRIVLEVKITEDQTTIAQLFSNSKKYTDHTVTVKGKVTRFSQSIMGKNWVHLQDGTEYNGDFDLVITTHDTVIVGNIYKFEGVIATDKDFGYGYFYSVLLEDAKIID